MGHGGKRPGSGRPKGGINSRTLSDINKAKESGELPHEFLLRVARGEKIEHAGELFQPPFDVRYDAAKAVAPFYAPKLQAIESKVEQTITDERFVDAPPQESREEWEKRIKETVQ